MSRELYDNRTYVPGSALLSRAKEAIMEKTKPTIAELEALLDSKEHQSIEILPSGEIRAVSKDAEIAALKQENERLKIKLEFNPQRRSMESFAQEVIDLQQTLAAAEARERELREKVEDFLSCERIIRDAGIMDNYTDAARARNRQAAIINEWKQLLGGEK